MTIAYNHAFDLAFSLISDKADAEDVTPLMLRTAIKDRLASLSDDELLEACGFPFDTYEIED